MKKISILLVFALTLILNPNVLAKEVNNFVSKADTEISAEDDYNSSVAIAGESVFLNGNIHGIAFGAGNKVELNGSAEYTALAGNSITIKGNVANDTFVAGNLITVTKEANIQRDAFIAGSDVELSGTFARNINVFASKVTLKEVKIDGNIKIYAKNIIVENTASVNGTLYYPEDSKYTLKEGASVASAEKTPAINNSDEENYFVTLSAKIWSYLGLALVFAAISLFVPNAFNRINEKYKEFEISEGIEVFTKGLVALILVPVIAILLLFTMIGIPLSFILLILYGIAIYCAKIFTAYLIGYKIWQKVFNKEVHILLSGLIGLVILLVLELIPGVRLLVTIIAVIVGIGLIFDMIKPKQIITD